MKTKLATSVSTTSLAVAVGRDVKVALLIDEVHESFGFLRWSRVDMVQQAIHRECAGPHQIRRILHGMWWYTIHLDYHSSAVRTVPAQNEEGRRS